ncbi:MAG: 2-dehydropantoate 2-reductase [Rubrivivax sp.]
MRIAMLGCGALGGLFAHHLALAGARVAAIDTWAEHAAAIREHGLRLQIGGRIVNSPLREAHTDAAALQGEPVDLLFLFTKSYASREALEAARPLVGPATVLLTLQNGLGNPQLMHEMFPQQTVLYGVTTLTSDTLAPGLIEPRSTTGGVTDICALDGQDDSGALARFVALLQRGGIAASAAADIDLAVWKKLVINCAFNGLCAVADLNCGQLVADARMWPVLDGIAAEVAQLARARGVALADAEAAQFLRRVADASKAHYPSMVDDLRHRRRTEIDGLNGAVLRACSALGLDAPANRLVHGLVSAVEARNAALAA